MLTKALAGEACSVKAGVESAKSNQGVATATTKTSMMNKMIMPTMSAPRLPMPMMIFTDAVTIGCRY